MFRPRLPATIELRDGVPSRVFFRGVYGSVIAVSGPWRTSGDWWREDFWLQDEWDIEVWVNSPSARIIHTRSSFFRAGLKSTAANSSAKRNVLHLFRCGSAKLVRARDVRLMYTELHARSAFSFLEGAALPEDLATVVPQTAG